MSIPNGGFVNDPNAPELEPAFAAAQLSERDALHLETQFADISYALESTTSYGVGFPSQYSAISPFSVDLSPFTEQVWWASQPPSIPAAQQIDPMACFLPNNGPSQIPSAVDMPPPPEPLAMDMAGPGTWQEKVRTERRRSQNRAAQRAYRERKDKTIMDMREQLQQREAGLRALQQDHHQLRERYESLLAAKQDLRDLSVTATLRPSDLMPPEQLVISGENLSFDVQDNLREGFAAASDTTMSNSA